MQVCKSLGFIASMLLLSSCANIAAKHAASPPAEAITSIAKEYSSRARADEISGYTIISVPTDAELKTWQMAQSYCMKTGGRPDYWPSNNQAFNCVDRQNGGIHFAAKREGGAVGVKDIRVLERTKDNNNVFSTMLTVMGYQTREQILEARQRAQQEAQQRLIQMRLRNRDQVAYIGARVCQIRPSETLGYSNIVFVATVEQVAGDRLKLFVERAYFQSAPNLAPGGFRQEYAWVNVWDIEPCRI
ncbi:hypothetical protein M2D07_016225 [Pseudomonas sp. BGr12]|uniref:hypothetical protein n=1 Tax=Pseudomonas sp. BGr12 TaxID=2936269 RepID=UPI002559F050|nr:hypothetical protein [Pseudomonas sp. BJa5]MDL2428563.1 hypothetical protein [Pseudomonas sp. BJa5]